MPIKFVFALTREKVRICAVARDYERSDRRCGVLADRAVGGLRAFGR